MIQLKNNPNSTIQNNYKKICKKTINLLMKILVNQLYDINQTYPKFMVYVYY